MFKYISLSAHTSLERAGLTERKRQRQPELRVAPIRPGNREFMAKNVQVNCSINVDVLFKSAGSLFDQSSMLLNVRNQDHISPALTWTEGSRFNPLPCISCASKSFQFLLHLLNEWTVPEQQWVMLLHTEAAWSTCQSLTQTTCLTGCSTKSSSPQQQQQQQQQAAGSSLVWIKGVAVEGRCLLQLVIRSTEMRFTNSCLVQTKSQEIVWYCVTETR